jgi:hypothetical protein
MGWYDSCWQVSAVVAELAPIDVGAMPDLARLAEEVRATGRPRRLRRSGEDLAVLVPAASADDDREQAPSDGNRQVRRMDHPPTASSRRRRPSRPLRFPKGGVVVATAGIVRYSGSPLSIEQERAAFEQGVADEAEEGLDA